MLGKKRLKNQLNLFKIISKSDNGLTLSSKVIMLTATLISSVPYGLLFSWLFFIVGLIFVWLSEMNQKQKWQWTVIPLIIWIPIMFLFLSVTFIFNKFN
jgi:sterol desaturase/sphingolipid hydroxylase (fatty acid hydroxylase superfamily)